MSETQNERTASVVSLLIRLVVGVVLFTAGLDKVISIIGGSVGYGTFIQGFVDGIKESWAYNWPFRALIYAFAAILPWAEIKSIPSERPNRHEGTGPYTMLMLASGPRGSCAASAEPFQCATQGLIDPSQLLGGQGELLSHLLLARGTNLLRPVAELRRVLRIVLDPVGQQRAHLVEVGHHCHLIPPKAAPR